MFKQSKTDISAVSKINIHERKFNKSAMIINGNCGHLQWQIQDFPEGGANSQSECANLYFCRKLHEIELMWTRGAHIPGTPFLGSANDL